MIEDEGRRPEPKWDHLPRATKEFLSALNHHKRSRLMDLSSLSDAQFKALMVWINFTDDERDVVRAFAVMSKDERLAGYAIVRTYVKLGWLGGLVRRSLFLLAGVAGAVTAYKTILPALMDLLGKGAT